MFEEIPNQTIIRLPELMKLTGLKRSTIYALIKKGEFPRQINLSERCVGWALTEINAWRQAKIENSRG